MIAVQDLRIGNWVTTGSPDSYHQIKSGKEIDQGANRYSLIPITPDLLAACGFAFHSYFKLWQKNKSVMGSGPDMELDTDYWVLNFSHQRIGVELKSLHQLQNVYYFLKGRELLVNLPEAQHQPKEKEGHIM